MSVAPSSKFIMIPTLCFFPILIGARCGDAYVIFTAIYIVNAVFLTTFMLANIFDVYEITDQDEELIPFHSMEDEDDVTKRVRRDGSPSSGSSTPRQSSISSNQSKPPNPIVNDLYLTGIGK